MLWIFIQTHELRLEILQVWHTGASCDALMEPCNIVSNDTWEDAIFLEIFILELEVKFFIIVKFCSREEDTVLKAIHVNQDLLLQVLVNICNYVLPNSMCDKCIELATHPSIEWKLDKGTL